MTDEAPPAEAPAVTDEEAATELVAVGGAMVDRYYRLTNLPPPDGGSFVRESWRSFGGSAANVACAAAGLGRSAGQVTRLGTDQGGEGHDDADAVAADLQAHGVDTTRVRRGEETGTYSMILAGPDGQRMVVTGGDSVRNLRLVDGDWPYLQGADVVFTNAYAPDHVVADLVAARADGDLSALAFDLSGPLPELADRGTRPDTIDDAVGAADLLVAGEVALSSYCDHHGVAATTEAAVGLLRERGVTRAALTRGEEGATLVHPDDTVAVDAFDVDVVDATGAGDAFAAALVDAWVLDDRPPAEAGRFAAAAAALNCTAEGARGGLATRGEVLAFLDDRT
ncbi:MAG: carbohydrate kinase family protein [Halobacteriales archaeon]